MTDPHPLALPNIRSGAFDLRSGDRFVYDIDGRHGRADEFLHDGEAFVTFDDGTHATIKWNHMSPERTETDAPGRKILAIFAHFESRPGTTLNARQFLTVGSRRRWGADDMQRDLEFAVSCGWVISTNRGFELSTIGYRASGIPTTETTEPILLKTGKFRMKSGRLQEGFTHRPWVNGGSDPTYMRWIDVPEVSADAPDEEVYKQ
jgi:hypothetical protein